jgi:predicted Rossmann fold nucleotide-binding protein DprA/Smf involved in DNA uptake
MSASAAADTVKDRVPAVQWGRRRGRPMTDREHNERLQRQISTLLDYPGIGALTAGTIARNLGISVEETQPVLLAMVASGHLARRAGDHFARHAPVCDGSVSGGTDLTEAAHRGQCASHTRSKGNQS